MTPHGIARVLLVLVAASLTPSLSGQASLSEGLPAGALMRFGSLDARPRRPVTSLCFTRDGHHLVTGSDDGTASLWDLRTGRSVRKLAGHEDGVKSIALSPDGKVVATGSWDATVRTWDFGSGQPLTTCRGHEQGVASVAFSPDGKLIASGAADGTARLWDANTGKELRRLKGESGQVVSVAFSPDGRILASCGSDRTVRLWDVATGSETKRLGQQRDWYFQVAFSPDGKLLAAANNDGSAYVWEVSTGEQRLRLLAHVDAVLGLAFSEDGTCLLTSGYDRTVRLWEVATGRERICWHGHANGVRAVAFSPDGRMAASASSDTTAMLWDVTLRRGSSDAAPDRPTVDDLQTAWDELARLDAGRAHRAIWVLADGAPQSLRWLEQQAAIITPDAGRVDRLVLMLDSPIFTRRQEAYCELQELGDGARRHLQAALGTAAPETHRRLEMLLRELEPPVCSPALLRGWRVVDALAKIRTPEARQILERLSRGNPQASLSTEAQRILELWGTAQP